MGLAATRQVEGPAGPAAGGAAAIRERFAGRLVNGIAAACFFCRRLIAWHGSCTGCKPRRPGAVPICHEELVGGRLEWPLGESLGIIPGQQRFYAHHRVSERFAIVKDLRVQRKAS